MKNQQFRVPKQKFHGMAMASVKKTLLPLFIMMLLSLLAFNYFQSENGDINITVLLATLVFFLIVNVFSFFNILNKRKHLISTYVFAIESVTFIQDMEGIPQITIPFYDVEEITKMANGDIYIKRKNSGEIIAIPYQIENYEELMGLLENVRPVKVFDGKMPSQYPHWIIIIATSILMIASFASLGAISGIAALIMTIFMTYFEITLINKGKSASQAERNAIPIILIVIFSMAFAVFKNFFG